MIGFNDYTETLKQLQAAYTYWQQNGAAFKYTDRRFEIYSRRNQCQALAEILNSL